MNKIFFKFASFWWFCLNEIPLSDVSAQCVTFHDERLAVCHCPCVRFETFFRFVCRGGTSQEIASIFFGRLRMTYPLFVYSLYKISEITRVQSLLLFRWFQTTPMNAMCRDVFLHSKRTAGIRRTIPLNDFMSGRSCVHEPLLCSCIIRSAEFVSSSEEIKKE